MLQDKFTKILKEAKSALKGKSKADLLIKLEAFQSEKAKKWRRKFVELSDSRYSNHILEPDVDNDNPFEIDDRIKVYTVWLTKVAQESVSDDDDR